MIASQSLSAKEVYHSCDLSLFDFKTTSELDPLSKPIGQDRALEAIEFGIDIKHPGFHIFALGPPGVGKHQLVNSILARRNVDTSTLFDWCYVNNFEDPQKPLLLKLDAGMGTELSKNMLQLVEDILISLPSAFQNEEYRNQRGEIEEAMNQRYEKTFSKLSADAKEQNIALVRTPAGFTLTPVVNDNIITPEEFSKLPVDERKRIEKVVAELQVELQQVVSRLPLLRREASHDIQELNRSVTRLTVEQYVGWLENQYQEYPEIIQFLTAVKDFAIENAEAFLPHEDNPNNEQVKQRAREFTSLRVNVIVDNTKANEVPLIFEDNPTYQNLIGRVEYESEMGNFHTDLTLIRAGALHRANGGYLVLEARKLLSHLFAWEGLKRALKSGEVKLASIQEMLSLGSTISLDPESIPIDVKVILLGEPILYYMLNQYDPEFTQLFNVSAEFSADTDRNPDSQKLYARMIATIQQQYQLRPMDTPSVGRIIEHASRIVEDSEKLSLKLEGLRELIQEADYWAGKNNSTLITIEDVDKAIYSQRRRQDSISEKFQEQITRNIKLIDTNGKKIAQVNGLSLMVLGDFAFGLPTRITATARLGTGKVIDIEREANLGGDLHSKGVMIISAYIADRYAHDRPLPLSASLVFEQSYGGVDGDSASCAEVCVLLSAIGKIPLRQDLAVTGSMNQLGEVQAIGGINSKIEGFFDTCKSRGLTGSQGIIMPAANRAHLMLKKEVRDSIAKDQFHIYTTNHIDEVMTLLSEQSPGKITKKGVYTKGSFNRCICDSIDKLQQLQQQFVKQTDIEKRP